MQQSSRPRDAKCSSRTLRAGELRLPELLSQARVHAQRLRLQPQGQFLPCRGRWRKPSASRAENYVFTSQDESSPMRLIDFGCAKVAADDEVISDVAGSPYYCSPEVSH